MERATCPKCGEPTLVYCRETTLEAPIYIGDDVLFYKQDELEEDPNEMEETIYCESCDFWMGGAYSVKMR